MHHFYIQSYCDIDVDLGQTCDITEIRTQGSNWNGPYYVTSYELISRTEDSAWAFIRPDAYNSYFDANVDATTIRRNVFPQPVQARYVRLKIRDYVGKPGLKWGIGGSCEPPS